MLDFLESWINRINEKHEPSRQSCSIFQETFKGFYTPVFLRASHFVVVDSLPKPDAPELRNAGLGDFIDMDVDGITYKDTYYILPHAVDELRLHFHELVHVLQWRELTIRGFIKRYIEEIKLFGYESAPLERMAYKLDDRFNSGGAPFNIEDYVQQNL